MGRGSDVYVPEDNGQIIADDFSRTRRLLLGLLSAAMVIGATAAVHYARLDLTIAHYDARAHLVVARRIVDSLTPGWRQIGAVWLPLPHLVNLLPATSDLNYRTGYLSTAISVAALAIGLAALGAYLLRKTHSVAASIAGPSLVLLNPNILYLQSTPMSEPLLFGLSFLSLAVVDTWMTDPTPANRMRAGWSLAALTLTRYEGWPIAVVLVATAALVRRGQAAALGCWVLAAVVSFLALGRASTGSWFVSTGFFVPDNPSRHDLYAVIDDVVSSTRELAGDPMLLAGLAGAAVAVAQARRAASALAPLALVAAAALPIAAFYQGHPHRVRYMLPLVVASGVLAAVAIGHLPRRFGKWAAAGLVVVTVSVSPPLDRNAPMVTEAQWETPFRVGRQAVTRYLATAHDGTPILASMGSLGHYMQEASAIGLHIENFVHEGNGDLWTAALKRPQPYVRWILIEERAEGGDVLAGQSRSDVAFLSGFSRVAEGGGLALYRREH